MGTHTITLRLWSEDAWLEPEVSAVLSVTAPPAAAVSALVGNGELVGSSIYIALGETHVFDAVTPISRVTYDSKLLKASYADLYHLTLTPRKTGKGTLTVKWADGTSKKYTVYVMKSLSLAGNVILDVSGTVSIPLGKTYQLGYKLQPSTSTTGVKFVSSNKRIAAVNASTGLVTPRKVGTVTITVTATATGRKDTVKLRVYNPKVVTSVTLAQGKSVTLLLGQTLKLTPVLHPSTGVTTLRWRTGNKRIVKVSGAGVLTPVKEGTATVTLRTKNGKSCRIKVTVVNPRKPKSLSILANGTAASGTITCGTSQPLQLTYKAVAYGGDGYTVPDSTLKWSTSNKKIATISSSGVVTVKKAGTVTFTLKHSGGKKVSLKVKFIKTSPLTGISVSPNGSQVSPGTTKQMTATLSPSNAGPLVSLRWWSSNTDVATVNQKGLVTAVSTGTAVIYALDENSQIYGAASIVVSVPPVYRAIVAVEPTDVDFGDGLIGYSTRQTDLNTIVKVLGQQNYDGQKWSITKLHGSSKAGVLSAINTLAGQASSNDVSLFFFMGHGSPDGSICFYDGSYITPSVLKLYLDKIPGKVIVMLGSCYSGTYIAKGASASSFNSAIMAEFAQGETVPVTYRDASGTIHEVTGDMLTDDETGFTPRSGELRQSKYYVLTATAANETGWSTFQGTTSGSKVTVDESSSYTYFVQGVGQAGGWNGLKNTTVWSSGSRTLSQVYSTVHSYCAGISDASSNVQVYPAGSSFVIFKK